MRPESTIPTGFCQCGCGEKTRVPDENDASQGVVKGVPMRFIRDHHLRLRTPIAVTPEMYTVDPVTQCWNWNGAIYRSGYGRAPSKKGTTTAHRWAYELLVGPVPDGLQLDHLCRNRRCINPDHLEPVTATENIRRSPGTKITIEIAREIRALRGEGTCDELAARFGVSRALISLIQLGKIWTE